MFLFLLSLFSLTIMEGDIKGVWLHISPSDTLYLNGKGIERRIKGDTTFIHLQLKQENLFNTLGIGLKEVEIGIPEQAIVEIQAERSKVEIDKGLKISYLELSSRIGRFRIDLEGSPGNFEICRIHSFLSKGEITGLGDAGIKRFYLNSTGSKVILALNGEWKSGAKLEIFSSFSYLRFKIPKGLGIISNRSDFNSSGIPILRLKIEGGMNRIKKGGVE